MDVKRCDLHKHYRIRKINTDNLNYDTGDDLGINSINKTPLVHH